jgi:hypothetical protein
MNDQPPPPDPLAVALSKLDPAPHGFNRDALMFAAGQTSKLWLVALWRAIAVAALISTGVFAWLYFTKPPVIKVEYQEIVKTPQ